MSNTLEHILRVDKSKIDLALHIKLRYDNQKPWHKKFVMPQKICNASRTVYHLAVTVTQNKHFPILQ